MPLPGEFSFASSSGTGETSSKLTWFPNCESLASDFSTKGYNLTFRVTDNSCPYFSTSTKQIKFLVRKPNVDEFGFTPPNAFSPNGDGINDTYTLSGLLDPSQNLPIDACDDNFEYISFVDRTGIEVYNSLDRNFEWDGRDLSPGVYYYFIKYTLSEYKGAISIFK